MPSDRGNEAILKFDAETTRQLEIAYAGADVIKRRRASFDALAPEPGETIIDIGSGNGLLTAELARAVGPTGRIIGVDPSEDMHRAARARCDAFGWVELVEGFAAELPVEDGIADKAVSVQVFEYLDDIPAAVREAHRALRAGGRLAVADIHFDSWLWHSEDPARMRRMMESWDHHVTERRVPALLPPILRETGFADIRVSPVTIHDHVMKPDGLAKMLLRLMSNFAIAKDHLPEADVRAWVDEQETLATEGKFFFSLTQFVISGTKA